MRVRRALIGWAAVAYLLAILTPCPSPAAASQAELARAQAAEARAAAAEEDGWCHGSPPPPHWLAPVCSCGCEPNVNPAGVAPGATLALLAAPSALGIPGHHRDTIPESLLPPDSPTFEADHVPLRA